jgi:large subunit ribosomal protein L21e
MAKRIGGSRRKSRKLLRKQRGTRGKININRYFIEYKDGDKVKLMLESGYQKNMFHTRFYGKVGVVQAKRGKCFEIKIQDGNKDKVVIVHPLHLTRVE